MSRILWSYDGTSKGMTAGAVSLDASKRVNIQQFDATYDGNTYSVYTFIMSSASGSSITIPVNTWNTSEQLGDQNTWTTWVSGDLSVKIQAFHSPSYSTIALSELRIGGAVFRRGGSYVNMGQGYGRDIDFTMGYAAYRGIFNDSEGIYISLNKSTWTQQSEFIKGDDYVNVTWLFIPDEVLAFASTQDPYSPSNDTSAGDPSESGGYGNGFPDGNHSATSEAKGIVFPFGSGLHCYVITPAQLNEFSRYMWGNATGVFDEGGLWGKFQNYKFNPIAGILSCHSLPLVLMPTFGGSAPISIAGTTLATATGAPCSTQFSTWVSDTVQIPEPWGTFVDYAYATISIYLPFCGVVPVDVSAVVGGSIYVRYYCDVINGNVSAWIVGTDRNGVQQLLKTATGNAAYHIPVTGNDNGQGEIIGSIKQAVTSGLSGNAGGLIAAGVNIISGAEQHHTESVGSMNGNAGYCASTEVFLICNWSYPIYTGNYDYIRGRPSEVSGTVGSFSGYNEFEVHADSISGATDEEKREIESLLNSGVYV